MAFEFLQQWLGAPVVPLTFEFLDSNCLKEDLSCDNAPRTWRLSILSIVYDCLDQIDLNRAGENDNVWHQEARQRALNLVRLGLSAIVTSDGQMGKKNLQRRDIEAIKGLGGAYRLLAKISGLDSVQCSHVFRCFLTKLAQSYAPVCGEIELDLLVCPLVMQPIRCRSMILCTGMLIQGVMRQASYSGIARRLDVELLQVQAGRYMLSLRLPGRLPNLLGSPEFDVASRLCAVLRSEFCCREAPDNGISIRLSFADGEL
jgi:hypothetical protein